MTQRESNGVRGEQPMNVTVLDKGIPGDAVHRFMAHVRVRTPKGFYDFIVPEDALATASSQRVGEQAKELSAMLEHDRTKVAECLTRVKDELHSYDWLITSRGSYEWNDDKWHEEFKRASEAIWEAIEPMVKIAADWKGCPTTQEEIQAARAPEPAQERVTCEIGGRESMRSIELSKLLEEALPFVKSNPDGYREELAKRIETTLAEAINARQGQPSDLVERLADSLGAYMKMASDAELVQFGVFAQAKDALGEAAKLRHESLTAAQPPAGAELGEKLRKLVEKWRKIAKESEEGLMVRTASPVTMFRCADELESVLAAGRRE